MCIDFSQKRWEQIKQNYGSWWDGTLNRPLINVELTGKELEIPKPGEPIYNNTAMYDFTVSADLIIKHWEYILAGKKYIGDAFPNILPDFGPGVNAAFMGATGKPTKETVWFETEKEVPLDQLRFEFQPEETWFRRIYKIYETAARYFNGSVCLGMTHLNNGIDPIARFFSSETVALSFYDDPDNLKRLIWECHELCFTYFDEFVKAMGSQNPGFTCWGYMFSEKPHFIWQSDFSAMIGPNMFREFILPELEACCRKIPNSFYHLDGPGELPHLDMILNIPELKGVQWIPGAGQPDERHWPEVYKKIRDAGKLIQILGDLDTLDIVTDQLGSAEGVYLYCSYDISREEEILKRIEKYGVV